MAHGRSAPLCWGQRFIWLNHHQLPPDGRHDLHFTMTYRPPAGSTTVQNLRLAMDLLVRRHEGLRTTWSSGDGGPAGQPTQRVHPPGPLPVRLHETTDGTSRPAEVLARLTTTEFRLDREWPIRVGIVCTDSAPTLMVVVVHHAAVDDWSFELLKKEYADLHDAIVAKRPVRPPAVRQHPVDLARFEASPAAQASNALALAQWERVASAAAADPFWSRRTGATGAHSVSLSSPAVMAAAQTMAVRCGVWPSLVYTAAFTAVLAAYTGTADLGYQMYAANRGGSHGDVVTCRFQPVPVHVGCADDPPFSEVVSRTAQRCGEAMQHSSYGYDEALEAVSRLAFERGAGIRLGTAFNYVRSTYLRRGGQRTIVNRNPEPAWWRRLDEDCYLRVSDWLDCTLATLQVSSAIMGGDDAELFLRGFETLLLEAAAGADPTIGALAERIGFSHRRHEPADLVVVDNTPVSPDSVAACLAEHPAVRDARVVAETTDAGRSRLTAHVSTVDPSVTPEQLRTHVLGRMYEAGPVCCPHTVVLRTVAAAGPARPDVRDEKDDKLERLLADAVCEANGLANVPPQDSYVMAGGRILNVPLVRQLLLDRGWEAPPVFDFASARPLRALATHLRPA